MPTINGTTQTDHLIAHDQADTLIGLEGDDTLDGGQGIDRLIGGKGNDTYVLDLSSLDQVVEESDQGFDLLELHQGADTALRSFNLGDVSQEIEDVTANVADAFTLTGNRADNTLFLQSGDHSVLDGGGGGDLLISTAHHTRFILDNAGDIAWAAGGANGRIESSVSLNLTRHFGINDAQLTGSDNLNAIGNSQGNWLGGNAGDNKLSGGRGNDSLEGGGGADTLQGGHGQDRLSGGSGNDLYQVKMGEGPDVISDFGGDADVLRLSGVNNKGVVFRQDGWNLVIETGRPQDKVTVESWFCGPSLQLEAIHVDNASISNQQVNQLAQSMASFDFGPAGPTPEAVQGIAVCWTGLWTITPAA